MRNAQARSDSRPDASSNIYPRNATSRRSGPAKFLRAESKSGISDRWSARRAAICCFDRERPARMRSHRAVAALAIKARSQLATRSLAETVAEVFEASSFGHRDFSADAASFDVAVVHRRREHRRHHEVASIIRFDLVIDLERVRRRGHEEQRAIFANIDIIDA